MLLSKGYCQYIILLLTISKANGVHFRLHNLSLKVLL